MFVSQVWSSILFVRPRQAQTAVSRRISNKIKNKVFRLYQVSSWGSFIVIAEIGNFAKVFVLFAIVYAKDSRLTP